MIASRNRDHPVAGLIGLDPNSIRRAGVLGRNGGSSHARQRLCREALHREHHGGARSAAVRHLCRIASTTRTALEYRYSDRGKEEWLPRDKVLHVRGFTHRQGRSRLSPLAAGRQGLSIALATEEATGKTVRAGHADVRVLQRHRHDAGAARQFHQDLYRADRRQRCQARTTASCRRVRFQADQHPAQGCGDAAVAPLQRRGNLPLHGGAADPGRATSPKGRRCGGPASKPSSTVADARGSMRSCATIEKSIGKRLLRPDERRRFYAEFERNALLRIDSAGARRKLLPATATAPVAPRRPSPSATIPPTHASISAAAPPAGRPLPSLRAARSTTSRAAAPPAPMSSSPMSISAPTSYRPMERSLCPPRRYGSRTDGFHPRCR
jgi:hypothetical protein